MILKFTSLNRTALFQTSGWIVALVLMILSVSQKAFSQSSPVFTVCPGNPIIPLQAGGGTMSLNEFNLGVNATDADGGAVTYSISPATIDCSDVGGPPISVTVTAIDDGAAGGAPNTDCIFNIQVVDGGPFAQANPISVILDASGNFTLTGAEETAISNGSSSCNGYSVIVSQPSFSCSDIGTPVNVTVTIKDDITGSEAMDNTTVTVFDAAPTANCIGGALNLPLDASGNATINVSDIDDGSSTTGSTCTPLGTLTISTTAPFTSLSFTCADVGVNTVTLTATNGNGQTVTCTRDVNVQDNISPTITGSLDVTNVEGCDATAAPAPFTTVADIEAALGTPSITDNCDDSDLTVTFVDASMPGTCPLVITRTYTVTDPGNNTATIDHFINIDDTMAPTGSATGTSGNNACLADALTTGTVAFDATAIAAMYSDPCAVNVTFVNTATTGDDCSWMVEHTFNVSDDCGNTLMNETITHTGGDDTAPMGTAPAGTSGINACKADALGVIPPFNPAVVAGNYTDNCGNVTITLTSPPPTDTDVLGNDCSWSYTYVYNVEDDCGNNFSNAITHSGGDNTAPVIVSCAPNQVADLDVDCMISIPDLTADVFATDNCSSNATTITGTATGTAVNIAGGWADGSFDNTLPLDPEVSQTVNTSGAPLGATITDVRVSLDISHSWTGDVAIELTGPTTTGSQTIVLLANQCNGFGGRNNISATFDDNGSALACSAQTNPDGDADICANQYYNLGASITGSIIPVDALAAFAGANPNGSWTVDVFDLVNGDGGCLSNVTVDVDWELSGNAVSGVTQSPLPGLYPSADGMDHIVTLTASDLCGNTSTCTTTVTGNDITPPTFTGTPPSVTLTANSSCVATHTWTDPTTDDNCAGAAIVSQTHASPTTFPVGETVVQYIAQDLAGNTSETTFLVTVQDQAGTPPNAECEPTILNFNDVGQATFTVFAIDDGSSDNCGVPTLTMLIDLDNDGVFGNTMSEGPFTSADPKVFECSEAGTYNVQLTASDGTSESTCSSTVTVSDNTAPSANCMSVEVAVGSTGSFVATVFATDLDLNSKDNCGNLTYAINDQPSLDFDCADLGMNAVNFTVTDGAGFTSSCTATINVVDNTPPFLNVPTTFLPNITTDCSNLTADTTGTTPFNTGDFCGNVGVNFTQTSTANGNANSCDNYTYTITKSWVMTDDSGNTTPLMQQINVVDLTVPTNPVFTASNAAGGFGNGDVILTNTSDCFATVSLALTNISDCAPFVNITVTNSETGASNVANGNYPVGDHTITFTTTDPCGNSSSHDFSFTVSDGLAPVASCVNSLNLGLPSSGVLVLIPDAVDNNSFDNCTAQDDLILTISPNTFDCSHVGQTIDVELTVSEPGINGLSSSCTTTVTIQENNDPTALCQPINIALDANGMATITGADVDGGSSDDCALAASPFSVTPSSFTEANIGVNNVTLTVTDAQGNTASCSTTVTIDYPPTCFEFGGPSDGDGEVIGGQGDIVEFPVHVTDFTNVNSFQFTMSIDNEEVGEFVDVVSTNAALDPAAGGNFFFSLVQTDSMIDMIDTIYVPDQMGMDSIGSIDTTYAGLFDQLSVNWLNPTPQTIADEGIAFTVRIQLTGDLDTNSPINPTTGINGNNPQISYSYNGVTSPALDPCFGNQGSISIGNVVIAGDIYNEDGDPANTVNVELYELPNTFTPEDMQTTIADGAYSFDVSSSLGDYTVRPYKYTNWPNGVTSSDVSDIQRHAIGVANFDFGSSYKEIAADMDNDLFVTTFDALLLNQYVASAYTLPPPAGIPSWRFVPAAQPLPYSSFVTVEPYDTTITFTGLVSDTLANDFIAVKMGDVNGDSNPQNITNDSADPFGDNDVHFQVKDQSFKAGDFVTVEVSADQFEDLRAYQWILQFDQNTLNFSDVQMGTLPALGMKNFGLNLLEEGKIVMTWFTTAAESKSSDDLLYSFTFEASRDGKLSELLSLGQVEHFRSEAYGIANGDNRNIDLRFTDEDQELVANFALMQNSPNPFKEETNIGFYLPEAATATLSLMDVSGRLLKSIEIDASKGYNAITVNKDDLPAAGVVHYKLETPTHSAVKKMVILN